MIVCICNNVNSDAIHIAIDNGASTIEHIRQETNAATCCGKCQFKVNRMLHERQQSETTVLPTSAVEYA